MKVKRLHLLLVFFGLAMCALPFRRHLIRPVAAVISIAKGRSTVAERVVQYGPAVRARLASDFKRAACPFPPAKMMLVGLKKEKRLEVWVAPTNGVYALLKCYPIIGTSGGLGPKLEEGDSQMPEGIYRIDFLNPNSRYHLSLRVDYPNAYDRVKAAADGRTKLGGDIMIHGSAWSDGCFAMGDPAAEDLFILAAETGLANVSVILSPVDFRVRELPDKRPNLPAWTTELYAMIKQELLNLK
jgi:hypothetical protein